MQNKLTILAGIATIIGTLFAGYSAFSSSTETRSQFVNGSANTTIGSNSGNITITNTPGEKAPQLVLKRPMPLIAQPNMGNLLEPTKHICQLIAGTQVALTGKSAAMDIGNAEWKEISIITGECAGQRGWLTSTALTYQ